ncbi:MAG: hypothetical protein IJ324_02185 [Lachnospiraceae bacterium]|nr:hypothetical protein [Lachnospiraceae bacterium]
MNNLAERIMYITEQLKGKSADYITHALKMIDGGENGTMAGGIQRIVSVLNAEKNMAVADTKLKYGIGGAAIGVASAGLLLGGAWLHSSSKNRKLHEKECQEIVEAFEAELEQARKESVMPQVEQQETVVEAV